MNGTTIIACPLREVVDHKTDLLREKFHDKLYLVVSDEPEQYRDEHNT